MVLSKVKLSAKMWGAFGVMLILLCVTGSIGVSRLTLLSTDTEGVANVRVPQLGWLYEMAMDFDAMARSARNISLTSDPAVTTKQRENYEKAREGMLHKDLPGMEKLLTSDKDKQIFSSLKTNLEEVMAFNDKAVSLGLTNHKTEASEVIIKHIVPSQVKLFESMAAFKELEGTGRRGRY